MTPRATIVFPHPQARTMVPDPPVSFPEAQKASTAFF
jgi:hypothetical protein